MSVHTYPSELACDAVAADGSAVHLRPIRPEDVPALVAFHEGLSAATVYRRFHGPVPHLSRRLVQLFTDVDYTDSLAMIVERDGRILAVAGYTSTGAGVAEVAFVVADEMQGRGLGTLLLEHLAAAAVERGIDRFVAVTQRGNAAMLRVFHDAGFRVERELRDGLVHVAFPLKPTEDFIAVVGHRQHLADRASLERMMCPRSVAVVGAGRNPHSVGRQILDSIVSGGYCGVVSAVNLHGTPVGDVPGFSSLADVPPGVDLVIAAVPPAAVLDLVGPAADVGAAGLLVVSAGFAETGAAGAATQQRLVDSAHSRGLRIIGPNCLGIASTDPQVRLNATFGPAAPEPGNVGLLSQSGGVGIVALRMAEQTGLGLSAFVSAGNKADVSSNDLLEWWEDDDRTDVICLYLESFGNPRRFAQLARRVARRKPIVALKSGRSPAGMRAAASHTAAAASPDATIDALFAQAGVLRVDTMTELFDTALLLATQPLPAGPRVGIVGNAGGPGILATDACATEGLAVPTLAEATQERLRTVQPSAATSNPVDLLAVATGTDFERAIDVILADDAVDAVLAVFIPTRSADVEQVAAGIARAAARSSAKPVIACFLGAASPPAALGRSGEGAVPSLPQPERVAAALARAVQHRAWLDQPEGRAVQLDGIDSGVARAIIDRTLADRPGGAWLDAEDAFALAAGYGIPTVATMVADGTEGAVAAARSLGYPVAVKPAAGGLVHKTETGAVRLDLHDDDAVRGAVAAGLAAGSASVVVQPMAAAGTELIVGLVQHASLGPVVLFGMGGVMTDLWADQALALVPLTDRAATDLVHGIRGLPLLTGFRGRPAADLAALEDLLLRVSRLAEDVPEVAELDCNPVIARPDGVLVVDVKVRVALAGRVPPAWLRTL